jgi:hypothetical protein
MTDKKPSTVRHTKYKILELAAHVDIFNFEEGTHINPNKEL